MAASSSGFGSQIPSLCVPRSRGASLCMSRSWGASLCVLRSWGASVWVPRSRGASLCMHRPQGASLCLSRSWGASVCVPGPWGASFCVHKSRAPLCLLPRLLPLPTNRLLCFGTWRLWEKLQPHSARTLEGLAEGQAKVPTFQPSPGLLAAEGRFLGPFEVPRTLILQSRRLGLPGRWPPASGLHTHLPQPLLSLPRRS